MVTDAGPEDRVGSPDTRGTYHKEVDTLQKLFPQKPKVGAGVSTVIYYLFWQNFSLNWIKRVQKLQKWIIT
jgi:hypothetical protein